MSNKLIYPLVVHRIRFFYVVGVIQKNCKENAKSRAFIDLKTKIRDWSMLLFFLEGLNIKEALAKRLYTTVNFELFLAITEQSVKNYDTHTVVHGAAFVFTW